MKRLSYLLLLLLLPALGGCQWMTEDYGDDGPLSQTTGQYLNLTISVGGGHDVATRATPSGGENGDGREAGFERENTIGGITLILADGPLGDGQAKVQYARYFPVTRGTALAPGTTPSTGHSHTSYAGGEEVVYTTGNCLIEDFNLREDKDYHAIVLANCYVQAKAGDLLSTVQDQKATLSALYQRSGYGPDSHDTFAMASEQDVVINFGGGTGVTQTLVDNAITYTVDRAIVIERLAARIDFCTNYAGGAKTAPYVTSPAKGYKYAIDDNHYFILERIIPFNLYNEQEYLFKRVQANWDGEATPTLLGEETAGNYVADPLTRQKVGTAMSYLNAIGAADEPAWAAATPYCRPCEAINAQGATSKLAIGSHLTGDGDRSNVFVLAYAMENTLRPDSPLKTYATGLVFTGSYYTTADDRFLARQTHYGFLRHQGEEASAPYPTYDWSELPAGMTGASATPMNFSIVRNNIYRVSIDQVSPYGGRLQLTMAVHDWRHVDNPVIYI